MDLERVLISKIIFTGQVEEALSRRITSEHFYDDECRKMYEYITEHTRRYKSPPSLEAAKYEHPEFEWIQTQETIDWVVDRFAVQVKRKVANDYLEELARAADDRLRSESIDLEFLQVAQNLIKALPSTKVNRFTDAENRIKEYEERKKLGKPVGIRYGYPTLDKVTGGIKPWQLVTVLAFATVGKSTFLKSLAFNFWMNGHTPLFFSLEMEAEEILHAFDAMAANLDFQKLRQLELDDEHMKNWKSFAKAVKERKCDIPIIDDQHRITPDQVYAEMLRHKPDVAIIDYVGLMRSSRMSKGLQRFQQVTDITQDLKIVARMLKIPIIIAAQTNRSGSKDGAELDNVAESISISQDSDVVIGLFQDDDMIKINEMEIRVSKNRGGKRLRFIALWDHDKPEFREKTLGDLMKRHA